MPVTPKQLANLIPVKKGEVRNPAGRPKKKETIAEILERFGNIAIGKNKTILGLVADDIPPELLKTARTLKHLALLKQVLRASKGDLKSLEYLSDRCEGKPVATVATIDVTPQPLFGDDVEDTPFGFCQIVPAEPPPALPESPPEPLPALPPQCLQEPDKANEEVLEEPSAKPTKAERKRLKRLGRK